MLARATGLLMGMLNPQELHSRPKSISELENIKVPTISQKKKLSL